MNPFHQALGSISGGSVLDIATGRGQFIEVLIENLDGFTDIAGVDTHEPPEAEPESPFSRADVAFVRMDTTALGFDDERFDTVTISNSLHHLADTDAVLAEAMRVLKRGGRLVVSEMYRDGQSGAQLTHVYMHHWIAEIDTLHGVFHNRTYTRRLLVGIVNRLGLRQLSSYDCSDSGGNPKDESIIRALDAKLDDALKRAGALPNSPETRQRGQDIRLMLHDVGFRPATLLVAVGEKV